MGVLPPLTPGGCVESGQTPSQELPKSRGSHALSDKASPSPHNVHYGPQPRPHCTSAHGRRELECACARASPGGSGSDKARWAAGRGVQGAPGGRRRGGAERRRRRRRREQSCSAVRGDARARSRRAELDGPLPLLLSPPSRPLSGSISVLLRTRGWAPCVALPAPPAAPVRPRRVGRPPQPRE